MNAKDIRSALRKAYSTGNATAIAFEVAQGTGRHANRHVDAVVMELWPSRGLTLHAMEIKVSLSDLKRELRDGQKAEEVAQHCDFFSIVCPLGMCRQEKLPDAWGMIEVTKDGLLKTRKMASRTKARPVDREFMAAMLRSVSRRDAKSEVDELLKKERENIRFQIAEGVKSELTFRDGYGAKWAKLEQAIKDVPGEYIDIYSDTDIMRAVAFVLRSKLLNNWDGVLKIVDLLGENRERLRAALKDIGIGEKS